jgi:hypothetical protein
VTDISGALADVRQILDRLEASRSAGRSSPDSIRALLDNASVLLANVGTSSSGSNGAAAPAAAANGVDHLAADEALDASIRRSLDEVGRIAANLQNGRF